MASWMVWQKVSCSPGWTNTSREAMAVASSVPVRNPSKWALGSSARRDSFSGPEPMTTTRVSGSESSTTRSETCFSGASRPT